jgi:peptide/nickel transport system permease protein
MRVTLVANPPGAVEIVGDWKAAAAPPENTPEGFAPAGAAQFALDRPRVETLEFEVQNPKGAALQLHAVVPEAAGLGIARVFSLHALAFGERFSQTLFFQKSIQFLWLDFGYADDGRRISLEIAKRIPPSLSITLPMFLVALLAEITIAMMLAYFRGTYLDLWGVVLCVIMMSVSIMFYVIGGQWLIGKTLLLAPISGFDSGSPAKFIVMPVIIGVIAAIGSGARWYRAIFLEEVGKDYIRTARMKGLPEGAVLYKHALKNAMLPILTSVIVSIPFLFMGTLILENFFAIPGMGSFTIEAINRQDFAIVQAMVVLGSYLYILGLILTDISYTLVDPRVRLK